MSSDQQFCSTPLTDLPVAERDQRIAETLAFMAERGYDFTAPGEAAAVVRDVHVNNDPTVGAAYVRLCDAPVARTIARSPEVNVDLGPDGQVVGVEVLYAAPGEIVLDEGDVVEVRPARALLGH